jgi:hypothetical protein
MQHVGLLDRHAIAHYTRALRNAQLPVSVLRQQCCHRTRTSAQLSRTPIVVTLEKARHGVGVSREPAKLGGEDSRPKR